jgi:hypothetical protein
MLEAAVPLKVAIPSVEPMLLKPSGPTESLRDRVNRAKARWLKRVMYDSPATSTQKCFAYAVADHLNCVTLDAWPGLLSVSRKLGFQHVRTVHRAARGLERHNFLILRKIGGLWRLGPVFRPADEDRNVPERGQSSALCGDRNVHESYLSILLYESDSTRTAEKEKRRVSSAFPWQQRGEIEMKVAEWLGVDGIEVLGQLALLGDDVIERLCTAYVHKMLTDRELAAARLAVEQMRLRYVERSRSAGMTKCQ